MGVLSLPNLAGGTCCIREAFEELFPSNHLFNHEGEQTPILIYRDLVYRVPGNLEQFLLQYLHQSWLQYTVSLKFLQFC